MSDAEKEGEEEVSMYEEWKKLLAERDATPAEADWLVDEVCDRAIALLASDVAEAESLVETRFDDDDLTWLCEIIEDLVAKTGSVRLVEGARHLLEKYPEVDERYPFHIYVDDAEKLLGNFEPNAGSGTGV